MDEDLIQEGETRIAPRENAVKDFNNSLRCCSIAASADAREGERDVP
jgi:hypothetical protein